MYCGMPCLAEVSIKPIALAVLELHLSEVGVRNSFEISYSLFDILLKSQILADFEI